MCYWQQPGDDMTNENVYVLVVPEGATGDDWLNLLRWMLPEYYRTSKVTSFPIFIHFNDEKEYEQCPFKEWFVPYSTFFKDKPGYLR